MLSRTKTLYVKTAGSRLDSPDQHHAEALLLGLWYDVNDHTYNGDGRLYDADTMEPLADARLDALAQSSEALERSQISAKRDALVKAGQLGFRDHDTSPRHHGV